MIDFAKIQILCVHPNELLNKLKLSGWDITGEYDHNTGEIKEYPLEAILQGLKIAFKSEKYIELSGSLHKYFEGGKNYRDFTFSDLLQVIIFLNDSIGLNPFTSPIRHLEFGVNITPPFITTDYLQRILNYKGTNFNPMPKQQGVSLGIVCERTQLNIKIYCKKTQYNLPDEVMRIELKVFKMQYLKPYGINKLIDLLNPYTWQELNKQLAEMFAELIITDDSIAANELPEEEKKLIENWSNPKHLEKLIRKDRKKFEQERRKFRTIIQSRSKENQQQKVVDLLWKKGNQLLSIDDNAFTKFTEFVNLFKNESAYHFYHSINREIWNNPSPSVKSFPKNLITGQEKNSVPAKEIDRQKEVGKIGKRVIEQVPIKKEEKTALPENWDKLIAELETYFNSISRTPASVNLNTCTTITNVPYFIESHLAMVKANKGNRTFEPYLERLMQLQSILLTKEQVESLSQNLPL